MADARQHRVELQRARERLGRAGERLLLRDLLLVLGQRARAPERTGGGVGERPGDGGVDVLRCAAENEQRVVVGRGRAQQQDEHRSGLQHRGAVDPRDPRAALEHAGELRLRLQVHAGAARDLGRVARGDGEAVPGLLREQRHGASAEQRARLRHDRGRDIVVRPAGGQQAGHGQQSGHRLDGRGGHQGRLALRAADERRGLRRTSGITSAGART